MMVQDVRNISLSMDEVLTAYECYQRMTEEFLPHCVLTGCSTTHDGIVLTIDKNDGNGSQEIVCKDLDVLRPLIRFCIENNIMLPRDGKKSLLFEADKVILHIELDLSTDRAASLDPMYISHIKNLTSLPKTGKVKFSGG